MRTSSKYVFVIGFVAIITPIHVQAAAEFFTDNEQDFISALAGWPISLESFGTPFATAGCVDFGPFEACETTDGVLQHVPASLTDGIGVMQVTDSNSNGTEVQFVFDSPIVGFSIDTGDALDQPSQAGFLSLGNNNGDSNSMFTGPRPTGEIRFIGLVDTDNPFTEVTLIATQIGDNILMDRLQFAPVPVPAAILLFISALAGLRFTTRRKVIA